MLRTRLIAGPRAGFVLSAVVATLLTIISVAETFFEPLRVRPGRTAPVTLRLPPVAMRTTDAMGEHHLVRVAPVIARAAEVHDRTLAEYVQLYESARRPVRLTTLFGSWFIYFLISIMMVTYCRRFAPSYGTLLRTQVGLLSLTVAFMARRQARAVADHHQRLRAAGRRARAVGRVLPRPTHGVHDGRGRQLPVRVAGRLPARVLAALPGGQLHHQPGPASAQARHRPGDRRRGRGARQRHAGDRQQHAGARRTVAARRFSRAAISPTSSAAPSAAWSPALLGVFLQGADRTPARHASHARGCSI